MSLKLVTFILLGLPATWPQNLIPGSPPDYLPKCHNNGIRKLNERERYICECSDAKMDSLCRLVTINLDEVQIVKVQQEATILNSNTAQKIQVSFKFITAALEGNGRLISINFVEPKGTLDVHLYRGKLSITFNRVQKNASIHRSLSDNRWHDIDIFLSAFGGTYLDIEVLIDRCRNPTTIGCSMNNRIAFPHSKIHFADDIEVGPFKGCFDRLRINKTYVDFWIVTWGQPSRRGCPDADSGCIENGRKTCGKYGICKNVLSATAMYTCRCVEGYQPTITQNQGPDIWPCINTSTPMSMTMSTYHARFTQFHPVIFRLSIRTRSKNFVVFAVAAWNLELKTEEGKPKLQYQSNVFKLPGAMLSDGNWHNIQVTLTERYLDLTIDDLDGAFYGFSTFNKTDIQEGEADIVFERGKNETCLDDAWVNFEGLTITGVSDYPLIEYTSTVFKRQTDWSQTGLIHGCSSGESVCTTKAVCPAHRTCIDEWQGFRCECVPGWKENSEGNCVPGQCLPNPCIHGDCSAVNETTKAYQCSCHPNWLGEICDEENVVTVAGLQWYWMLIILLLLVLIIVIIIVLAFCCCRRKKEKFSFFDTINAAFEDQKLGKELYQADDWAFNEKDFTGAIDYSVLEMEPEVHPSEFSRRDVPHLRHELPSDNESNISTVEKNIYPQTLEVPRSHGQKTTEIAPWEAAEDIPNIGLQLDQVLEYGYEGVDGTPPPELRATDDGSSNQNSSLEESSATLC